MMRRDFCPTCNELRDLMVIDSTETMEFWGQAFTVPVHFLRCSSCRHETNDSQSKYDALLELYNAYSKRNFPDGDRDVGNEIREAFRQRGRVE